MLLARGPRHAEACLLAEVEGWHAAVRADPRRLARPLRIVVPSGSLREHVAASLARRLGALAGVTVQTHHRLALDVLERAGRPAPAGSELQGVLVRRHARAMPALRESLDALDDGYGVVAADVDDLLDAGLDAGCAEAAHELLEAEGGPWATRARDVVEVALAVQASLARHGLARRGDVVRLARECLEAAPDAAPPTGRLLLHGYADATGVVTDLLRALVRRHPTLLLLDRPPDPIRPEADDLGVRFSRRFEERMAWSAPERAAAPGSPGAGPGFFRAPGTDAEVREVARRILARVRDGAPWESIGVVTRTPERYAAALRTHFRRLAIPFSGVGLAGPRSATGRRVAFLLDLLRDGERTPADRLVDHVEAFGPGQRADLRLGLHALGAARLAEVAALDPGAVLGGEKGFPLPVRRGVVEGLAEEEAGDEARGPHASRRRLSRRALEDVAARAREVVSRLADPDAEEPLGKRIGGLADLLRGAFGWREHGPGGRVLRRLAELRADLPDDLPVGLPALRLVLERALRPLAHDGVGGAGGGVQVLDVTEARGRTFDHLFVPGLNRDLFPRVVTEDALLPDAVRRALGAVLPDLPVKESGHDEEHFLFAQLLASSPDVTLSWQVMGDDGKALAASPLVERTLPADREAPLAPSLHALPAAAQARPAPRPAHEWALLAGLHADAAVFRSLLPVALEEAGAGGDRPALASARAAAVAEIDAIRPEAGGDWPGPYLGTVGPRHAGHDLRDAPLYVTTLERAARCPWQAFLSRVLRLEQVPDALEALPRADDKLLLGSVAHAVLERIVREAGVAAPDEAHLAGSPTGRVPWPDEARLAAWAEDEARRLLFENGVGLPGFARVLAGRVAPWLDIARELDWAQGPVPALGSEVDASVVVDTSRGPRTLRFRADRVDRRNGSLVLTDYKTGKPISVAKGEDTRRRHFLAAVAEGTHLQAAAYARAAPGARGRYLFVGRPDLPREAEVRTYEVRPDDADLDAAFRAAVDAVLAAWEEGAFVPRLDGSPGGRSGPCASCDHREACLQGDSGARRRVLDWAAAPARGADGLEGAAWRLWHLGAEESGDG